MKLNNSKILIVLVLAVLLFSLFGSFTFAAERGLEVEYPKLDGEEITATTTLPEYVKYIFKFSLIIAAVAAFAILIYGGFRYLTSAGAPETMREAKSWMFGGILGLVLLLCSYLILTTINPELLSPKEPKVEAIAGIFLLNDKGRRLYYNEDIPEIPEGFKAEKYAIEFISNKPQQEYKTTPKKELISVFYYRDKNWEGEVKEIKNPKKPDDLFVTRLLDFFPKSIHFLWNEPGVYLFEKESHETPAPPELYKASAENLGDFDDKAKSVVTT